MKKTPRINHKSAGSQPHWTATIGPTMGPSAAMDLNWYPNSTLELAGMKSTPSLYILAGVALFGSAMMTDRSMLPA